jgi:hypothetical protein
MYLSKIGSQIVSPPPKKESPRPPDNVHLMHIITGGLHRLPPPIILVGVFFPPPFLFLLIRHYVLTFCTCEPAKVLAVFAHQNADNMLLFDARKLMLDSACSSIQHSLLSFIPFILSNLFEIQMKEMA